MEYFDKLELLWLKKKVRNDSDSFNTWCVSLAAIFGWLFPFIYDCYSVYSRVSKKVADLPAQLEKNVGDFQKVWGIIR